MTFRTEKQMEALLASETRLIPMPGGEQRPFTATHMLWEAHDYLLPWWTAEELTELAMGHAERSGYSFDFAFVNLVGFTYRKFFAHFGNR